MYPKNFARFYDTIYHQLRDGVDNQFFLDQVIKTKGKILEVGVGTGRLFMEALQHGADIYGIDISQSMIDVLVKKLDPATAKRIYLQNIIDFDIPHLFDLIVAPFRVMMHLISKQDQIAALNNVYRQLVPGGVFIFDVFNPDLRQLVSGLHNHVDFDGEYEPGKKLKRIVTTQPDLLNQIINVNFRMEWDEDDKAKHDDWNVPLRYYFRYELEHLVERSAFENYTILGDYSGNELNADSKEFIVICRKQ